MEKLRNRLKDHFKFLKLEKEVSKKSQETSTSVITAWKLEVVNLFIMFHGRVYPSMGKPLKSHLDLMILEMGCHGFTSARAAYILNRMVDRVKRRGIKVVNTFIKFIDLIEK